MRIQSSAGCLSRRVFDSIDTSRGDLSYMMVVSSNRRLCAWLTDAKIVRRNSLTIEFDQGRAEGGLTLRLGRRGRVLIRTKRQQYLPSWSGRSRAKPNVDGPFLIYSSAADRRKFQFKSLRTGGHNKAAAIPYAPLDHHDASQAQITSEVRQPQEPLCGGSGGWSSRLIEPTVMCVLPFKRRLDFSAALHQHPDCCQARATMCRSGDGGAAQLLPVVVVVVVGRAH